MNINYGHELQKLKDSMLNIFADLTNPFPEYREQGKCNLNGLVDQMLVLAQLQRRERPTPNSPHAEAMLENMKPLTYEEDPFPW